MKGAWIRLLAGVLCAGVLAAFTFLAGQRANERPEDPVVVDVVLAPIQPAEFVVAPCQGVSGEVACAVIAAGGKRVFIGAPAGIGAGFAQGDQTPPDRVLLWSLNAEQIEGLDELRNRAWRSGRRTPLIVAGGRGLGDVVTGLNAAFITSDALAYVDGTRAGGFDVAALEAAEISIGDTAFDTGDLTITALPGGADALAYLVAYRGTSLVVAGCNARAQDIATWPDQGLAGYIGCEADTAPAPQLGSWPLEARIHVKVDG